ncbi:TlpA disulfide reductase family protein [Polaribacter sp. Z022]|uniref:TlpA family protein disulfide reductase n=1 Tax=Polaribacter sp. Z022 TaxID=2927125 RepID=UPI002021D7A8|nr:TlpA disulfide reductase family protein [Polaribacter sp. Z022]MCL7752422.1 TlpA family protein disulfide reductase [Polaribacter sp. Z022]
MKKILVLIFFISSLVQAQYTINGTMTPTIKSDWVILYKIEGARQKFVQNTKIKIDSVEYLGKKQAIGTFTFTLPKDTKIGSYRATYKLEGAGFVDFIFNKEDVSFGFHPDYPNQSITFSASKENIFYKQYLDAISKAQQTLDSIQVKALQNPDLDLKAPYKTAYTNVNNVQISYLKAAENMYVKPFVQASFRNSSSEIIDNPKKYMSNMVSTFFDRMDFNNKALLNSSFLVDRITDYVFYINYSEDPNTQQKLYKESIIKVMSKIKNNPFKKDVIEFLISQFETTMNLDLIDYLFDNHYNKLPESIQNKKFKDEKQKLFAAEIGRIAPNFSWKENGKTFELSKLNDAENYLLIFWSTGCSHCIREIPQIHKLLKENKKVKVIAFSLEQNDFAWKNYKKTLPNWHHVLGLNKWENKTARTYNIVSTPSYFVLNKDKKIIAKPDQLKDVKAFLEKL